MENKSSKKDKTTKETLEAPSLNLKKDMEAYYSLLKEENKNRDLQKFKHAIAGGENYIRQTQRTEIKKFDDSIIEQLEEGLGAIERIIANPRTFIKEQAELVQVGLAKRVSSVSIRHFATHSQFVRNIDENNEVIPEKVLTIFAETDTAIYENRFVMTLIKRCLSFIQTRYNYIVEHGETRDSDLLIIHNKLDVDNLTYEVDSRIKVSIPSMDDGNLEKNRELLEKLTEMKNRCSTYLGSSFMAAMKGAKEVSSPIHMTNMIVKQPDYHKCYLFWEFLDNYEELGISFDVSETNQNFSKEYLDEINTHIANSILLLHNNRVDDGLYAADTSKEFNPKVIFTLEDETFADGKYIFDAYPEAYHRDILPPSREEVIERDDKLKQKIKNQKDAKKVVEKNIANRKDEIVYEEAIERKHRSEEIFKDYDALINEIYSLREEVDNLQKELDELKKE